MANWNTNKILKEIKEFCYDVKIIKDSPGGDHDTKNLSIYPKKDYKLDDYDYYIFVCGFDDQRCLTEKEWDNVDVPYIQIRDGRDSGIAINSTDEEIVICWNNLKKYFQDNGFITVDNIKDFF